MAIFVRALAERVGIAMRGASLTAFEGTATMFILSIFSIAGLSHLAAPLWSFFCVISLVLCGVFGTEAMLRVPLLLVGLFWFILLLASYFSVRIVISAVERTGRLFRRLFESRTLHEVRSILLSASPTQQEVTWEQYREAAAVLDERDNGIEWRLKDEEGTYNWVLVRQLIQDLRAARTQGREELVAVLDRCLGGRNVGGVLNEVHGRDHIYQRV